MRNPYAVFCLFFMASLIDMIVLETNQYASEMSPHTKTVWTDVVAEEITCFLALIILMGNQRKATIKSY